MSTTTKRDLIDLVARDTSQSRVIVRAVVQSFLAHIIEEIRKGNRLEFRDFGVFEVRHRSARVVRNPRTQQPVVVAPDRTVKFKAGRAMKKAIDRPCRSESASRNGEMVRSC